MLSVAIHKDIAEYQPKVIGKLTGRTLISITVALGLSIAVAVYMNLVLKIDPTDHLEFIYAVSLPCWCCGFWKPHGLPFEQFALLWLQHQLSDNRLFYKPSMFKSGFVKTPDEIAQSRKGKLYDKSTRKFLDGTNGLEAYSPMASPIAYSMGTDAIEIAAGAATIELTVASAPSVISMVLKSKTCPNRLPK